MADASAPSDDDLLNQYFPAAPAATTTAPSDDQLIDQHFAPDKPKDTTPWLDQPPTPGFTRSSILPIAVNPDIHNLGGIQWDAHGPAQAIAGLISDNSPAQVAARGNITPELAGTLLTGAMGAGIARGGRPFTPVPAPAPIPAVLGEHPNIPGLPLTPAMQGGASAADVATEGALRAKYPSAFKQTDADLGNASTNAVTDVLDTKLNQPTKDILYGTDSKGLFKPDGTIDPVKYSAWLDQVRDPMGVKYGGVKGGPKFTSDELNQLEDVRDVINQKANLDNATQEAKGNKSALLNNLGTNAFQRAIASKPGYGEIIPEIAASVGEGILNHSVLGPSAIAARYAAAKYMGPRVTALNNSAIQDVLSRSTNMAPPTYKPGAVIATPTTVPPPTP